jgi:hypothetical protein
MVSLSPFSFSSLSWVVVFTSSSWTLLHHIYVLYKHINALHLDLDKNDWLRYVHREMDETFLEKYSKY